jgi:GWxTD domain-containing protein
VKRLWLLWISVLVPLLQLQAGEQSSPTWNTSLPSSGSLHFYSDICQFEGTGNKTLVEISYAIDLSQLQSPIDADNKIATLQIQLTVVPVLPDSTISWVERKTVLPVTDKHSNIFIDLKRQQFKPGTVDYTLNISDSASGRSGRISKRVEIRDFTNSYSLSDISFIRHLQKSAGQNPFAKNGLLMVPDPERAFYKNAPEANVYIYYEINHMSYQTEKPSYYDVHYAVTDLSGKEVWSQIREGLDKKSSSMARVEKIPLAGFYTGLFKLNLLVVDTGTDEICKSSAYFSVYSDENESRLVLPMTDDDIQRYADQIRYITTDDEKKIFQQLDAFGKQKFLIAFWKSKDPDPSTPQNEFMEQYFSRLAHCEKSFRGGINSDMARIYLTYGPPLEIDREPSFANTNQAVETWIYAINGRTEFVFVDRIGDGHYVLAHSTHPDEYQNENWQNEVNATNEKR